MEKRFLAGAYELALNGRGKTFPNPCVGAVLVRDGEIVGEGFHAKAGEPHAEVLAVESFLQRGEGFECVELYVTLEPCCHVGKTPPCTDLILKHGIKKVFVGCKDPSKKVDGKGLRILSDAGVEVEVLDVNDDLARKIRMLNKGFNKRSLRGLPYVVLKAGMSLDGKIATLDGESKWITSEEARLDAKVERNFSAAVMVGSGTVLADDPELNSCLRIIFDPLLDTDLNSRVYRDDNVLVIAFDGAEVVRQKSFEDRGVEVLYFSGERIVLRDVLVRLAERQIDSIFVEGGASLAGAFFDEDLVDEVIYYIAPKILGSGLNVLSAKKARSLSESLNFVDYYIEPIGKDIKYRGFVNPV